jgi:hypothetical protein
MAGEYRGPKIARGFVVIREKSDFIREKTNVVFIGPSGVGKTHLANAIGQLACLRGYRVRFVVALSAMGCSYASPENPADQTWSWKRPNPRAQQIVTEPAPSRIGSPGSNVFRPEAIAPAAIQTPRFFEIASRPRPQFRQRTAASTRLAPNMGTVYCVSGEDHLPA